MQPPSGKRGPDIVSPAWFMAGATVLAAGGVLAGATAPSVWADFRPATCMPDACFCEALRDQLVRQPANAVSGLAFAGVGMWTIASRRRAESAAQQQTLDLLFGATAVLLGAGTVLYHASLTFWAQTLDVFGMYLITTLIIVARIARLSPLSGRAVAALYLTTNAALLAGLVFAPAARRYLFGILVLVAVLLHLAAQRRVSASSDRRFILAVALLGAGVVLWVLDLSRVFCTPFSWLQGHALWHLLGAAAFALAVGSIRSAAPAR